MHETNPTEQLTSTGYGSSGNPRLVLKQESERRSRSKATAQTPAPIPFVDLVHKHAVATRGWVWALFHGGWIHALVGGAASLLIWSALWWGLVFTYHTSELVVPSLARDRTDPNAHARVISHAAAVVIDLQGSCVTSDDVEGPAASSRFP
jgi:hypothetical protein